MTQPYTALLDQFQPASLPLTDRSAQYLRDTVKLVETEIARLIEAEAHYLQEAAGAKAVRELLEASRDSYTKGLGEHAGSDQPQRWPIDPAIALGHAETCAHCGGSMRWAETHGFVHEVDGWWVPAGESCQQPQSVGQGES
ncbi:hypothetical protein ACIBK9_47420 [Nonomuraea sp. NPDC050227]|uniref:hypothetical protein n=1 Tax=Nonomuraea sp. NPDC050227 TaxID=3364360 RepID=UPI003787B0B2